jgi:hypothetical protein
MLPLAFLPVSVLPTAKARAADVGVMGEVDLANGRRLRMQVKANTDFNRVSEATRATWRSMLRNWE